MAIESHAWRLELETKFSVRRALDADGVQLFDEFDAADGVGPLPELHPVGGHRPHLVRLNVPLLSIGLHAAGEVRPSLASGRIIRNGSEERDKVGWCSRDGVEGEDPTAVGDLGCELLAVRKDVCVVGEPTVSLFTGGFELALLLVEVLKSAAVVAAGAGK